MAFDIQVVGMVFAAIWLTILSLIVWSVCTRYSRLVEGLKNPSASALLQKLVKENDDAEKNITSLGKRIHALEESTLQHIQKIGLVRFNPFQDTGGDQSFILALIDAKDSGIVISGLYSRSGTRWYAKKIINGKGVDHELSDEERKAINSAR